VGKKTSSFANDLYDIRLNYRKVTGVVKSLFSYPVFTLVNQPPFILPKTFIRVIIMFVGYPFIPQTSKGEEKNETKLLPTVFCTRAGLDDPRGLRACGHPGTRAHQRSGSH
jgi:hypothetical protein